MTNSRPSDLTSLFIEYPEARFDLFHAGYPYTGEVAALAKNFQNVSADMCWVYLISPSVGRRVLREYVETIPSNRVFGFGGDYLFVEGAYAHSRMARECVARTLGEMVDDGYFGLADALVVARKLLHDNAWEFYRLGERWRGQRRSTPLP
jgi:predicted TIM-barrel fold metal-dependent hydrolase